MEEIFSYMPQPEVILKIFKEDDGSLRFVLDAEGGKRIYIIEPGVVQLYIDSVKENYRIHKEDIEQMTDEVDVEIPFGFVVAFDKETVKMFKEVIEKVEQKIKGGLH